MPRLKTRLDSLERGGATASDESLRLLVSLVARRDALFYPWRTWGKHRVAIHSRQRDYLDGSHGISAKAAGRSDWKAAHYSRKALLDSGLARGAYSGGQVSSLFPSPLGDETARVLVAGRLRSLSDAASVLTRLREIPGREFCGRCWVSESELFGCRLSGNPSAWECATELVLPLLVAGLAIANCDALGRVYFSLNREAELPEVPPVAAPPAVSFDAERIYFNSYRQERLALANAESASAEILLPLPASGW